MRIEYDNGYYVGDVNYNDDPHGYGKYVWNDGTYYEGEWRDGDMHGHGKRTFDDGAYYIGDFVHDECHGRGKYVYDDGTYYEGEWRDGEKHGNGKYTGDGWSYEGEFRNGDFNGYGTKRYANGNYYVGYFSNDQFHGKGTWYQEHSTVSFEGNWIDDENATDVTKTYHGKKTHGKMVNWSFEEDESDNIITYEGRRYVEIDGYYFGEEAMARMQPSGNHGASIHYNGWAGRSIFPKFVIEAITYSINNGLTELQENGRNRHYCGSISVITTTDNRHVITVFDNPNQNK